MGYHMIRGLTAHYVKKGEAWRLFDSTKKTHGLSGKKTVPKQEPMPNIMVAAKDKNLDSERQLVQKQLQRSTSYRNS